MASMPKPTKTQLRQHALDRALQPDVVQALARDPEGDCCEAEWLATRIIAVASRFETYLEAAEEETA